MRHQRQCRGDDGGLAAAHNGHDFGAGGGQRGLDEAKRRRRIKAWREAARCDVADNIAVQRQLGAVAAGCTSHPLQLRSLVLGGHKVASISCGAEHSCILLEGGELYSFGSGKRAARTGRNPKTGETIKIPAAKTVKFTAGKAFKDAVNKR